MSKVARIPVPQKKKERDEFEVMIGNKGVETFTADTRAGAYKQAVKKHCKEGDVSFMKMTEGVITKEVLPKLKSFDFDEVILVAQTLGHFYIANNDPDIADVEDKETGGFNELGDDIFDPSITKTLDEFLDRLFVKNKTKKIKEFKKNLFTMLRSAVFYLRFLNEPQVLFCNMEDLIEGVQDMCKSEGGGEPAGGDIWVARNNTTLDLLKEKNGSLLPIPTYDRKKIAANEEYKNKFLNVFEPMAYEAEFTNSDEADERYEEFKTATVEVDPPTEDEEEEEETRERDQSSNIYIERLDKATKEDKLNGIGNYATQLIHSQIGYDDKSSGAFSQRNTGGYDEVYLLEDKYGAAGRKADDLWNENLGAISLLTGFMDYDTEGEEEITEASGKAIRTAGDLGFILEDAFEKIASLEEELQGRDTDKEVDVDNSDFQEQGKEAFDFFWDAKKPSFPKDLDFLDDEEKNSVYNLAQYVAILKDTSDQEALILSAQIYDDGIFPLVEELYRLGKESKTSRQELGGRFDRIKELEDRVIELETELVLGEEEEEKSEFTDASNLLRQIAELTEAREKDRKEIRKVAALERQLDDVRDEADDFARNALELEEKVKELEAQKAAVEEDDDEEKIDRTDDFDALFTILEQLGVDVDEVLEEIKEGDGIFEFLQSEKYTQMVIEPIERGLFS